MLPVLSTGRSPLILSGHLCVAATACRSATCHPLCGSWRPTLTPYPGYCSYHSSCHNSATGLLSLIHWPQGQALHNRVWPLGEPSPTTHPHPFAASAAVIRGPLPREPPRKPSIRQALEFRFKRLWSPEKGRVGNCGCSLLCASTVLISTGAFLHCVILSPRLMPVAPGHGSMCFISELLDIMGSLSIDWLSDQKDERMDGWMDEWTQIRLREAFSPEIKCFLPPTLGNKEKCCFLLSTFLKGNYKQATAIIYKCDGKYENLRELNYTFIPPQLLSIHSLIIWAAFVSFL